MQSRCCSSPIEVYLWWETWALETKIMRGCRRLHLCLSFVWYAVEKNQYYISSQLQTHCGWWEEMKSEDQRRKRKWKQSWLLSSSLNIWPPSFLDRKTVMVRQAPEAPAQPKWIKIHLKASRDTQRRYFERKQRENDSWLSTANVYVKRNDTGNDEKDKVFGKHDQTKNTDLFSRVPIYFRMTHRPWGWTRSHPSKMPKSHTHPQRAFTYDQLLPQHSHAHTRRNPSAQRKGEGNNSGSDSTIKQFERN